MAFMKRNINGSRRHPMAAILVIAAGLAVSGGGYAAATAAVETAKPVSAAASSAQVDEGHKLFLANCASCHGKNAEGTANAPSLIGVGAAAAEFQVDTGRMPGQASGPQLMAKPSQFTGDQVDAIAAYVGSLAPGPAIPTDAQLAADGNATRGGELFRINCAMCHNAVGAGGALTEGKYAPALTETKPDHIYEAMLTGPQNMPVFNDANLTPTDKKDIITYLTYVQTHPSAGGYELGNLGPVVEGLFIWIFALGFIIAITIWLGAKSN
jgi:ubiquinol-cytochrome c reductase cytochrome c subunit